MLWELASNVRSATDNVTASGSAIDPVCGMTVDPRTAVSFVHGDATHYFCCDGCQKTFAANPAAYLGDGAHKRDRVGPAATVWTCPMHPEIRRDAPGACPICGMALEPFEPTAEEGENAELADMTRRLRIGVALTAPLLVAMLAEFVPALDPMRLLGHTTVRMGAARARDAGRDLVRRAVLRTRLAVDRQSQPEHVHADRARHGCCVALLRFRDRRRRARCRRRSAARAAHRRSTSSLRP